MIYRDALEALYARVGKSSHYTLARMRRGAAAAGDPQARLVAAHVAGTNGKGSVAKMLFAAAVTSGLKTGLYTSPHLHRFTERIVIGRREIPRREVVRRFEELDRRCRAHGVPPLTFFEVATLVAFGWFADEKVDLAVVEVGLGGRLDATNILRPAVSVITSVGLEHCHILGPTLRHVAREKAGIVKPGVPVVCGELPRAAADVVRRRAAALGSPLVRLGEEVRVRVREDAAGAAGGGGGARFDYEGPGLRLRDVRAALGGAHQAGNAALCIAAAQALAAAGVKIDVGKVPAALRRVRWAGRLERLPGKPAVVLDCAHNPPAMRALARELAGGAYHLVFGALADKSIEEMAALAGPLARRVYLAVPPVAARAPTAAQLEERFRRGLARGGRRAPVRSFAGVAEALDAALRDARASGLDVLVTGSIFVVAEARARLLGLTRLDPPVAS